MNKVILLKNRPKGRPSPQDFEFTEEEKSQIKEGEILLKTKYVSVDPYLRGRMRDEKSYIAPFEVGKPLESGIIAEVVESNNKNFEKGDFVNGMLQWKQFQTSNGNGLNKVDSKKAPLKAYLGVLGLTGMTAYLGLEKIGKLEKGETLLVSGAAGAVGSVVGQIGKIKGCRVVGIAGSEEKIDRIQEKFGFDDAINYKTTKEMKKAIAEACPDGVDVYYDNVGGEILDAALQNMNKYGRIINCGAISLYNKTETPTGPRVETTLIKNSILMQGFTVRDFVKDFGPAQKQLAAWMEQDKLNYMETVVEGFENIPQAFIDLFDGKNKGKMIVMV
ncbi:NADP-dependent oxidoreductase [Aequorivita lipolytica]|uniref:NADP-dependent oxidoreductase n=1 Tax=Aequorivita lipolytica TaxID=153267 RepID=A0A5C6YT84_9FLAO|nr:NADP-dependent oxidoreductase [Aequorivita lipolytica]TXD70213.1 NADP-dependent oxidoreductase [Aequorivita lipolytica]SRX50638.1 Putative NADP-dependent oxidoreductase YfmJ [Aequorivita lipolytica]